MTTPYLSLDTAPDLPVSTSLSSPYMRRASIGGYGLGGYGLGSGVIPMSASYGSPYGGMGMGMSLPMSMGSMGLGYGGGLGLGLASPYMGAAGLGYGGYGAMGGMGLGMGAMGYPGDLATSAYMARGGSYMGSPLMY